MTPPAAAAVDRRRPKLALDASDIRGSGAPSELTAARGPLRPGVPPRAAPAPGAARSGWRTWRLPGATTPGPEAAARPGVPPGFRADAPGSPGTQYGPSDGPDRCAARWPPNPPRAVFRRTCPPAPRSPPVRPRPADRALAIPRGAPPIRCGPRA